MNTSDFPEELRKNVQTGLEAAGYRAIYQSSQKWPASFQVSSKSSQGGVTLFYGKVCEHCGKTLPYRIVSARGASDARLAIPENCDAPTAADYLLREILPLLTNRLTAATAPRDAGAGAGLLSPTEAGQLAELVESRGKAHS